VVLGLASSGAHSNGYSLIRRIVARAQPDLQADFHGRPFADALIAPTRIYVKSLLKLMESVTVKGMAHITGGGITGNVPRVLPDNVTAVLDKAAWTLPPLFQWLQREGNVADEEMHRVFNCGIGMVVVVAAADADKASAQLTATGETVYRLGRIEARQAGQEQTIIA
jgi:phosphoribosylformylglycinamidine cyclo-ligase